jgi:hypothetical protein
MYQFIKTNKNITSPFWDLLYNVLQLLQGSGGHCIHRCQVKSRQKGEMG